MIFSKYIDFIFIKFPFVFLFLYLLILFSFPRYENALSLLVMLFFAEPHFGATWTLFWDKKMIEHAKKNKYDYFYFTIFLVLVSTVAFFLNKDIFYICFFLYNGWHVTKQSFGICKLYSRDKFEINFQRNLIFISNYFIIFFGSILYLMLGIISKESAKNLGIIFLFLTFIFFVIQNIKYKNLENAFISLTGILIFMPSFFVSKPIHALLAGVTMHYSQYLGITLKINSSKNKLKLGSKKNLLKNIFKVKGYFIWIFFYGSIATLLTFIGGGNDNLFSNLLIIPILGQIIHFYLDGLVWKFKDPKIRAINLKYLF